MAPVPQPNGSRSRPSSGKNTNSTGSRPPPVKRHTVPTLGANVQRKTSSASTPESSRKRPHQPQSRPRGMSSPRPATAQGSNSTKTRQTSSSGSGPSPPVRSRSMPAKPPSRSSHPPSRERTFSLLSLLSIKYQTDWSSSLSINFKL